MDKGQSELNGIQTCGGMKRYTEDKSSKLEDRRPR